MALHQDNIRVTNAEEEGTSHIGQFFEGRHILVSGGIGFIGKVLLEKLLYISPGIGNVYVLVRPKKGEDAQTRLNKATKSQMFHRVIPNLSKLVAVPADVAEPGLALTPEWRQRLCKDVSVVFHVAATVNFNTPIGDAILLNTRGTKEMLELAKDMPKIEVFLHVSTTYCNTDRPEIDEVLYPPHADWRTLVRLAEERDPHLLSALTGKIIGGKRALPNTYTFSKSLAEHVVKDYSHLVPCAIVRPSIVISSIKEPLPGWIDNWNGPSALAVASAVGLVHAGLSNPNLVPDFVPVDVVVNGTIVAVWLKGVTPPTEKFELPIYNGSGAEIQGLTVKEIIKIGYKLQDVVTVNRTFMIATDIITTNFTLYYTVFFFLQLLPAIVADFFLKLFHQDFSLLRLQRKVYTNITAMGYFMTRDWRIHNRRGFSLKHCLKDKDIKLFDSFEPVDIWEYSYTSALGGRRYLLKEKDEDIPKAVARMRRVRVIQFFVVTALKITIFFYIINSHWFSALLFGLRRFVGLA